MLRWSLALLAAGIAALSGQPASAQDFSRAFQTSAAERLAAYAVEGVKDTIEIHTRRRKLYFIRHDGVVLRYPVGVGRLGRQWFGATRIVSKRLSPAWTPPLIMASTRKAIVIPGGAKENPMGAAALVLADNELAIHGTNDPASIGSFVSWGCIRMRNHDVLDLYERVQVGTRVAIMR